MSDRADAIMEIVRELLHAQARTPLLERIQGEIEAMEADLFQHAAENARLESERAAMQRRAEAAEADWQASVSYVEQLAGLLREAAPYVAMGGRNYAGPAQYDLAKRIDAALAKNPNDQRGSGNEARFGQDGIERKVTEPRTVAGVAPAPLPVTEIGLVSQDAYNALSRLHGAMFDLACSFRDTLARTLDTAERRTKAGRPLEQDEIDAMTARLVADTEKLYGPGRPVKPHRSGGGESPGVGDGT